ncbi:MAG: efflux RND transporter periplasmic adaptor subunit [Endomicrobium sp.]|jgi:macrolide-specific efflux system membrane fusion protein|nr:efflux RND transporter periplasmic adaptor subunit [Endomicrobium sp.]
MKKILIVFTVLVIAGVGVFIALIPSKQVIEQQTTLQQRELHIEFRETGQVWPRNRLEIKNSFAGRIEKILVNEGDVIKKGQIIIWMSSNERATMVDAARAMDKQEQEKWQNIYKPTPVVAPLDGFIIYRQKEPGQTVSTTDSILVMADDLIIDANIDETDLRYIKIGNKLKMYLDAYPDEKFEGEIEHISYEARTSNNVTVYNIKINPIKKPKVFRSGMTATITVTVASKKDAWSISNIFITEKDHKKTIIVKTGTEQKPVFETREIQTGVTNGEFTEILSGLKQDEVVVIFKQKPKEKTK